MFPGAILIDNAGQGFPVQPFVSVLHANIDQRAAVHAVGPVRSCQRNIARLVVAAYLDVVKHRVLAHGNQDIAVPGHAGLDIFRAVLVGRTGSGPQNPQGIPRLFLYCCRIGIAHELQALGRAVLVEDRNQLRPVHAVCRSGVDIAGRHARDFFAAHVNTVGGHRGTPGNHKAAAGQAGRPGGHAVRVNHSIACGYAAFGAQVQFVIQVYQYALLAGRSGNIIVAARYAQGLVCQAYAARTGGAFGLQRGVI